MQQSGNTHDTAQGAEPRVSEKGRALVEAAIETHCSAEFDCDMDPLAHVKNPSDLHEIRAASAYAKELRRPAIEARRSLCDYIAALESRAAVAAEVENGVVLIAAERRRQVEAEGWTPEHDDQHEYGEMARAAACYATPEDGRAQTLFATMRLPSGWPWGEYWWKPTPHDRIRELVKAGALIAAEIDRLQRAALPTAPESAEEPADAE